MNNEKIKEFIISNIFKIITFIPIVIGGFYLFFYLFNIHYFPSFDYNNFMFLSIIYFFIGLIISIYVTSFLLLPGILLKIILNSNYHTLERFFVAILGFILLVLLLYLLYLSYNILNIDLFELAIFITIVISFNYLYLKLENFKVFLILLFLVMIFSSAFISKRVSYLFHIGEYNTTIKIINNNHICNTLKLHINNNICSLTGKIVWHGNNYVIDVNNSRYKIPNKYILIENYLVSENNKTKNTKKERK